MSARKPVMVGQCQAALGVLIANQQVPKSERTYLAVSIKEVGEARHCALNDLALLSGATILGNHVERQDYRPFPSPSSISTVRWP